MTGYGHGGNDAAILHNKPRAKRKKQGHSHRWCETCRLYIEWIRWAKTEPSGLTIFLWTEYRKHRQAMP